MQTIALSRFRILAATLGAVALLLQAAPAKA
jgi:hypothetical protein